MNPRANTTTLTFTEDRAGSRRRLPFYAKLVLRALSRMKHGALQLDLPDGQTLHLGTLSQPDPRESEATSSASVRAHVHIRDWNFFRRCVLFGDIGFAESYMAQEWTSPDLRAVIAWFILNQENAPTLSGSKVGSIGVNWLRAANRCLHLLKPNSSTRAKENIREHYDLSNEFFGLWLDSSMMYSAARWTSPELSLSAAQEAKNEALCRQLRLSPADHVLEIGTGWGAWSLHAASRYGCRITTLTISEEQAKLAQERVRAAGLQDQIEVRLLDYRALPESACFDKIVSIEMLEAVGHRYQREWCRIVSRSLKAGGLLALQFITCPDHRYTEMRRSVDFIQKHIFPGSLLLSLNRLSTLLSKEGGFILHQLEDLGADYARTLQDWSQRFNASTEKLEALGFDASFRRKWNYYLAYCEAAFAMRNISVVQALYTRPNNLNLN